VEEPKQRKHSEIGEAGQRLAATLRRERNTRGWTTERLAQAVSDQGVPMTATTVTKIEKQMRRTTVDELVALAAALGLRPGALLLPADRSVSDEIRDFVSERVHDRPFVVEVYGFPSGITKVATYAGEMAVKMREGTGDGEH